MPSKRSAPELSQETLSQLQKRRCNAGHYRADLALSRGDGRPPPSFSRYCFWGTATVNTRSGPVSGHPLTCNCCRRHATATTDAPRRAALAALNPNTSHLGPAGVARSAGASSFPLLSSLQTVVETLICTVLLSRLWYFRHVCCSSKHGTSTCCLSPRIGTHNVRFCRGLQLASDPQ